MFALAGTEASRRSTSNSLEQFGIQATAVFHQPEWRLALVVVALRHSRAAPISSGPWLRDKLLQPSRPCRLTPARF